MHKLSNETIAYVRQHIIETSMSDYEAKRRLEALEQEIENECRN